MKNFLHVLCLLAMVTFTVIYAKSGGPCQSKTEMWGAENPKIYYICDAKTKTAIELECPAGEGFFKDKDITGCIEFAKFPKCISTAGASQKCVGENVNQPWENSNPATYYLCPGEGAKPVIINCLNNTGFVKIPDGTMGCTDWANWRKLKNCNYY